MKRIALLVAFTAIILASCKKEYECECTRTDKSKTFDEASTSYTIVGKQDDVAAQCELGDTAFGTITRICVVK